MVGTSNTRIRITRAAGSSVPVSQQRQTRADAHGGLLSSKITITIGAGAAQTFQSKSPPKHKITLTNGSTMTLVRTQALEDPNPNVVTVLD